jgi:hypothetical protein
MGRRLHRLPQPVRPVRVRRHCRAGRPASTIRGRVLGIPHPSVRGMAGARRRPLHRAVAGPPRGPSAGAQHPPRPGHGPTQRGPDDRTCGRAAGWSRSKAGAHRAGDAQRLRRRDPRALPRRRRASAPRHDISAERAWPVRRDPGRRDGHANGPGVPFPRPTHSSRQRPPLTVHVLDLPRDAPRNPRPPRPASRNADRGNTAAAPVPGAPHRRVRSAAPCARTARPSTDQFGPSARSCHAALMHWPGQGSARSLASASEDDDGPAQSKRRQRSGGLRVLKRRLSDVVYAASRHDLATA